MCLAKRKANSGPAGEAAGAEGSGPAGKAAGADIEWHDEGVMNRPEPPPTASLQVNMDLSPSLVPCFRALVFALAIYILALAYAHVAGTF
jgi:hypothetical protein